MEDKRYTIGQVCEMLEIKPHTLRYWDKELGLEIKRDDFSNRSYSSEDLNLLKTIKTLRDQGLNYKTIKNVIKFSDQENVIEETSQEIAMDIELDIPDKRLKELLASIENAVSSSIESKLAPHIETLQKSIEVYNNNSEDLKRALELQQEKHFKEIDAKLAKWREENMIKKRKKGLFNFIKFGSRP